MLVGHIAVGFAAKRLTPRTSLGTLVLAPLLVDLLWCLFMIAGLERVQIISRGPTLMTSVAIDDISYSHSLVTNALWASLFAAVYFLRTKDRLAAWVLFAAVLSHWPLDWISRTPDMPLAPGTPWVFGLGLWTSIPATLLVEGGAWLAAVAGYALATRATTRAGTRVFVLGVALVTAAGTTTWPGRRRPIPRRSGSPA